MVQALLRFVWNALSLLLLVRSVAVLPLLPFSVIGIVYFSRQLLAGGDNLRLRPDHPLELVGGCVTSLCYQYASD